MAETIDGTSDRSAQKPLFPDVDHSASFEPIIKQGTNDGILEVAQTSDANIVGNGDLFTPDDEIAGIMSSLKLTRQEAEDYNRYLETRGGGAKTAYQTVTGRTDYDQIVAPQRRLTGLKAGISSATSSSNVDATEMPIVVSNSNDETGSGQINFETPLISNNGSIVVSQQERNAPRSALYKALESEILQAGDGNVLSELHRLVIHVSGKMAASELSMAEGQMLMDLICFYLPERE